MPVYSSLSLDIRKIGYICDFEVLGYYDRMLYLEIECPCDLPEDAYAFYEDFVMDLPVKECKSGVIRPVYSMGTSK